MITVDMDQPLLFIWMGHRTYLWVRSGTRIPNWSMQEEGHEFSVPLQYMEEVVEDVVADPY